MKLYVNRTPVFGPWGGGNHWTTAFHKYAVSEGHELVSPQSMTQAPDVILLAGINAEGEDVSAETAIMYKLYNPNVKIVMRVNENDARKGTSHVDKYLLKLAPHLDGTVFVSNWLSDYFFKKGWPRDNCTVIINGVDQEIFKPQPKLNNGKLNIVAHHWSNNVMKGFDVYDKLDEFVGQNSNAFSFTYVGRERGTFKHAKVVKPLHGKALGEELGKYDLYVSASRSDPGPNHIIESVACGLPTWVIKDGGGCVEFAGHEHSYGDWNELELILKNAQVALAPNSQSIIRSWQYCVREYIAFLEATCKSAAILNSTKS